MRRHTRQSINRYKKWLSARQMIWVKIGGGLVVVLLLVQLFYPGGKLPLFARVDGVSVGGQDKAAVIKQLDTLSADQSLVIHLGSSKQQFDAPKLSQVGITVSNKARIEQASYPWYLRIIPTSLLWFGLL